MEEYKDETLQCVDCGRDFNFFAKWQEFYAKRGYTSKPERCTECAVKFDTEKWNEAHEKTSSN